MKIIKRILGIIVLIIVIGFFMPGTTHVERSMDINTRSSTVYEQINELKNWINWSPWAKLDPNTVWKYSEPSSGMGAYYTWSSQQSNVGKGKMTILDTKPNQQVRCKLAFEGMGESYIFFNLAEKDSTNTKVTWILENDNGLDPFSRWVGAFMDKMLGPDFEKGLANLKAYCEIKR